MSSDKDIGKPVSGEVIKSGEEEGVPVVRALFATLSRLPFRNFWQRKKIASMKEVFKEEKEFADVFFDHQKSVNRLSKLRTILRQDDADIENSTIEAENRLAETKRVEAARKRDDLIFQHNKAFEEMQSGMRNEYELKIQEIEYKKKLHALQKELADLQAKESAQPKKTRGPSTTALFREKGKVDKERAKRKAAIDASNDSEEKKKSDEELLDRWVEEQYEKLENQYGGGVD